MAYQCPICQAVSQNPQDEEFGYCGRCHAFTAENGVSKMCGACFHPLEVVKRKNGTPSGWDHSAQDVRRGVNHDPVPVEVDSRLEDRCDFCNRDLLGLSSWNVPTKDFRVVGELWSRGDWTACKTCVDFVLTNRWMLLVQRVRERYVLAHPGQNAPSRHVYEHLYVQLRAHRDGVVKRKR